MTEPTPLPALCQAITLLWRDHDPYDVVARLPLRLVSWPETVAAAWAALRHRFTVEELQGIDADLARLSPALLEEVCIGEMPEPLPIQPRTFEALSIITASLQ